MFSSVDPQPPPGRQTIGIYTTTLILSADLLFWIQPLVAKSLLPVVGDAPAIWQTVIMLFPSTVLLGYLCAHGLA
ncbi:MAG: hypothetical protein M2R45_04364 [Verrucomicrobia subdivision 3 bacterium]|nr:hypothetical protein [Limisphaerales bacterium]MCS1416069.1 hypothetical protein [Limisphaerales bacterium]